MADVRHNYRPRRLVDSVPHAVLAASGTPEAPGRSALDLHGVTEDAVELDTVLGHFLAALHSSQQARAWRSRTTPPPADWLAEARELHPRVWRTSPSDIGTQRRRSTPGAAIEDLAYGLESG